MPTLSGRRPAVQPIAIPTDADGLVVPRLIPVAAYLCVEGYPDGARTEILAALARGRSALWCGRYAGLEPQDVHEVERLYHPCGLAAPGPIRGGAPELADFAAAMAADDPDTAPIAESYREPQEWDQVAWDAACEAHDAETRSADDREPETLDFPDWILSQAALIRSGGSDAAEWLAAHIELLAGRARFVSAASPAQYDDRVEVLDR